MCTHVTSIPQKLTAAAAAPQAAPKPTDLESTEAFGERLLGTLNSAATAIMISLGHRAGLFDALEGAGPITSAELAARAEKDERYVREWLGSMVVSQIVEYDPLSRRYALPSAYAAVLTRNHPASNMAVFGQYIAQAGAVEDKVLECFNRGGGLKYSDYSRFHEIMAEDSGQTVLAELLSSIVPLIPGGKEQLERGIEVMDLGCGSARALNLLAGEFPASRFTGYDLCDDALEVGRAEARSAGVTNLTLAARDVTALGDEARFDLVFAFDAIHDQKDPDQVLRNIRRALKPGGVFLMQDIGGYTALEKNGDYALAPLLYMVSCTHCMSVSLGQGGKGYGAMWGREMALEKLAEAGFTEVTIHSLPHDVQNVYFVCRAD